MLIDRIYLRNYRVFEQELELALPPGLVGVYGPNGAGKSTLLESVLWTLWGRSRTPKEQVPSAGTRGECVSEVTFEHEGHIYLVRRTISGANATVRAQAHCDGLAMSEGVRDTARYVHSVLGMDDAAFRASVFAEQKQLSAFSSQGPAERRKLVLSLLGVTPLDAARDQARSDARETAERHRRLRSVLPDLDEARTAAGDAHASAAAAEVTAADEEAAAAAAMAAAAAAGREFTALDRLRQEHELLVAQGRASRAELDAAEAEARQLAGELEQLARTESSLATVARAAEDLEQWERLLSHLSSAHAAASELASLPDIPEPEAADDAALASAEAAAATARDALAAAQALRKSALAEHQRARQAFERSADLSPGADCPLCGQALGDAFVRVQDHRAQELEDAGRRSRQAAEQEAREATAAQEALAALDAVSRKVAEARRARSAWEQAQSRRAAVQERLDAAVAEAAEVEPSLPARWQGRPDLGALTAALEEVRTAHAAARRARDEASRLRGRLERRPEAERALQQARDRAGAAGSVTESLRAKVKALGHDPAALAAAATIAKQAGQTAEAADAAARTARMEAARAAARDEAQAQRLAEAQAQHAQLGELESATVHLSRTAELLNGFRNSVVASVGPRLAVQAAELFSELTDNEYDRLEVDTETYGLKISDAGMAYDLDRFSGSEVDLANLALRVAISEHVRFQSGGTVGLLVLDEVFGPLDEERKARMLIALERLRGRFRQVLVVTHSSDIKDQLPNAVEVVKRPGRRATARVVDPFS